MQRPDGLTALPLAGVLLAALLAGVAAAPSGRTAAPAKGRAAAAAQRPPAPTRGPKLPPGAFLLHGDWQKEYRLRAGESVEVSVRLERPSALPPNGRVAVEWRLEAAERPLARPAAPAERGARALDAEGIYTAPTANWRKVLHALDGSIYLVYRAPVSGRYRLRLAPVVQEKWVGDAPRWREKGVAPAMFPLPERTPWPAGVAAPVSVSVTPVDLGTEAQVQATGTLVEAEPNDTPEQAQPLVLQPPAAENEVRTYEITGTADDIEFFDNGQAGRSGDDWFRVELKGTRGRLVTAELGIPGQVLAARIRCYRLREGARPDVPLGVLVPIEEYLGPKEPKVPIYSENKETDTPYGREQNERVHQQEEAHRAAITRYLEPGRVYYFRVEANAPGYQLQLRVLNPAPYDDPRMAIRQGMYNHIAQVDAWLTNRPRGASVERRIRDTGNLLGTQCMSCHTQSGVWGPAVPIRYGYPVENVLNFRHLIDVMYECLRPTNELKDAAVNTSLAPLDLGDGPAGTRAAGYNIVQAERILRPKRLHSAQQLRTANYMLQTNDPGGINAAGPGSNVGQIVVWLFAGEALSAAWKRTGDPKYFRALEERARRIAEHEPKYTDDLALRLEFFGRVFPLRDYPAEAEKAAAAERAAGREARSEPEAVRAFVEKVRRRLAEDEARLRAIQNEDGSWSFQPGSTPDGGRTWKRGNGPGDPAPTALAITGLSALGYGKEDPSIARGVTALLAMQEPTGRWNRAAITGFVTTAYALHALARLYPMEPGRVSSGWRPSEGIRRAAFAPKPGETLLETVRRVQSLAVAGRSELADLLREAARHSSPLVRYWAMIGLGCAPTDAGVPVLLAALRDRARPVRDAATWALRQHLLDDRGWAAVLAAGEAGDDYTREQVMQALGMRADAVLSRARVDWARLGRLLDRAMNDDPHPAVRAWAAKAAWQWWIWNPPIRAAVNRAWERMLERPEPNVLVEHSNRYSSHALFIANGHKANASQEHQYRELAALFEALRRRLESADPATKSRMARRLVAVAATFYQTAGGDGGPGQMGYATPGAGALFGQAVVVYLREAIPSGDRSAILAGLEGAANIPHGPLQELLIDYTLKAPEELRRAAAAAVSDPRSAMLQAATELVEPLVQQVRRGALDPARRPTLSDPVLQLFGTVTWVIPEDLEQQRHFFDLLIPTFERYFSPQEIEAMSDAGAQAAARREMDAAWYLADRLGEVLAKNPDLHRPIVFERYFPTTFRNPLERHFWVRSVPWLLEHRPAGAAAAAEERVDPALVTKDRALQLYLDALRPEAPALTRAAAIRIANATAVRRNPEVLRQLKQVLEFEKDEQLRQVAENVTRQGDERFIPDLIAALKKEGRPGRWLTPDGKVDPLFLEDFLYFRDYVTPELARVKRSDQLACQGCHGVPGRVPSFYFKPTDEFGYLSVEDLLFNYRELQARVNLKDVERSKLLRKPLNIQDGQEDGHQGGRRYLPQDEGYQILKKWAENQPRLIERLMGALEFFLRPLFRRPAS